MTPAQCAEKYITYTRAVMAVYTILDTLYARRCRAVCSDETSAHKHALIHQDKITEKKKNGDKT